MFSLRTINSITKASSASRIVAGFPKAVASPNMQRASFTKFASLKQHVVPDELTNKRASDIVGETSKSRASDVSGNIKISNTLKRFTLDGKVAVVTGGARGLGNCIADALCDVNLKALVIFDVLKEHGDKAVVELSRKYGVPVVFKQVDVRDHKSVQGAVDETMLEFGKIDVLVAAAGIADSNLPAEGYDIEMFRRLIDINLTGTFIVAQAVGNAMIKTNAGGSMMFIASMSGHIVNWPQQQAAYNASKAGVIMLGKSLAAEWATYNIRVNTISPGYMDTALNRVPALDAQKVLWIERTPMERLGDVDELNNLAVFLAGDGSSFMTGTDIIIDGGYTAW